jgi:hypothetical protein
MKKIDVVYIGSDSYYSGVLTQGKTYQAEFDDKEVVYSSTGYYYELINDTGVKQLYYYGMFMELQKWRETQLNKIIQ